MRKKKNLTQRDIAIALDLDVSTIRNWEHGRDGRQMFARVAKLCQLLECNPIDLCEEEPVNG